MRSSLHYAPLAVDSNNAPDSCKLLLELHLQLSAWMHAFVSSDYLRVSSLTSCVDKCNEGLDLSDALGLVELASPWWYAYASSSSKEIDR